MGTVAKYAVSERQNFFDLAIQHCGDVSAAFQLALKNNLSVTDALVPGQSILLTNSVNPDVVRYYAVKGIKPATDLDTGEYWNIGRIFGPEFPLEFE